MALKYRMIVSDFDGTLGRSEGGISEGNIRAIQQYTENGGVFALCTGRMISSILPYTRELGLKGPVTAYQGAFICEAEDGKVLRDIRIDCAEAIEICEFLQSNDYHIHVYDGNDFYVNKKDFFLDSYERICKVTGIVTPFQISERVRKDGIRPQKILVMCSPEEKIKVFEQLQERYGKRYDVTTSSDFLVEITANGCDKGSAVRFLADYYGIPLKQIIAVGDNCNDVPMLKTAGLGVAVENAVKEAKEAAHFVTKHCDADGVAYVIKKFGLGENI